MFISVSEMNHSNKDCLIVTILSHGNLIQECPNVTNSYSQYIAASDKLYSLKMILDYFTDEKCPTLKNKPKLFFIQACQNITLPSKGFTFFRKRIKSETDSVGPISPKSNANSFKISPILPDADFLIAYATLPGSYSFRNENGSWFIQGLCKELNERVPESDLLEILNYTKQSVASNHKSKSRDIDFDGMKQIPYFDSALTKFLYLSKKRHF